MRMSMAWAKCIPFEALLKSINRKKVVGSLGVIHEWPPPDRAAPRAAPKTRLTRYQNDRTPYLVNLLSFGFFTSR